MTPLTSPFFEQPWPEGEDRLFQLDLFRRATSGRLAEILGSSYLDDDLIARRDYYTDAEVDSMLAEIPPALLSRAEAYRDGVNAWIDYVSGVGLPQMPGEFVALADLPIDPWTLRDTARVGIFLARTVPSGDGNELPNALALRSVVRRAGPDALERHWSGTAHGLAAVKRLAGVGR